MAGPVHVMRVTWAEWLVFLNGYFSFLVGGSGLVWCTGFSLWCVPCARRQRRWQLQSPTGSGPGEFCCSRRVQLPHQGRPGNTHPRHVTVHVTQRILDGSIAAAAATVLPVVARISEDAPWNRTHNSQGSGQKTRRLQPFGKKQSGFRLSKCN